MKKRHLRIVVFLFMIFSVNILVSPVISTTLADPGTFECYGYTSTTDNFPCGEHGNCTWWAAYSRPDLASAGISGDAEDWYDNAKNLGFDVGSEPRNGAIAVFSSPGHVAYLTETHDDGSFDVSEMDWFGSIGDGNGLQYGTYHPDGNNKYHRNSGAIGGWTLRGFIYWKSGYPGTPTTMCSRISATKTACWLTKDGTDLSCENATAWGIEDDEKRKKYLKLKFSQNLFS